MIRAVVFVGVIAFWPALASAQQPCTTDARHVVNELYRHMLERSADASSQGMVDRLAGGRATVRELVREIANSPEHHQRFLADTGGDAHQRHINVLYRHILGRQADPASATHVETARTRGYNPVVDVLVNSAEYNQRFGDWGVPGSGGVTFCAPANRAQNQQNQQNQPVQTAANANMRFRGLDRNNDGAISRAEWNGSNTSFMNHDWNGDGVLSGDEVRPGGVRTFRTQDEREFDDIDWSAEQFTRLDRNRDGRVSSAEWYHDPEFFTRIDRNRDGIVSRAEYIAADVDDDREDRFEDLDANGNGRVERAEWHGSVDAFDWLDRNRDNVLTRAEVVGNGRQQPDRFVTLDFNRDGRITMDEWQWSRRSFDAQDLNDDGVISRREFNNNAVPTTGR